MYYFFVKTKMYGFFQTTFYFGYMTMFCLTLAVMCGNRPMFLRTRTAPTPPRTRARKHQRAQTGGRLQCGAGRGRAGLQRPCGVLQAASATVARTSSCTAFTGTSRATKQKHKANRPLLCDPTLRQPSRPSTPASLCDAEEASGRVRTLGGLRNVPINPPPAQRQERALCRGSPGRPRVLYHASLARRFCAAEMESHCVGTPQWRTLN